MAYCCDRLVLVDSSPQDLWREEHLLIKTCFQCAMISLVSSNTAVDEYAPLTGQNLTLGVMWWSNGLVGPLPRPQVRVIAALGFVRQSVLRPEHRSPTPLIQ